MPRSIGTYDHLNRNDKFTLEMDMEEVARKIEKMNYGTHRFLYALVRIRRADPVIEASPGGKLLTDGIERLLNKGGF